MVNKDNAFSTVNPANGKVIKTYTYMPFSEVEEKIQACHNAYLNWRTLSTSDRAKHIENLAQGLEKNKEKLAKLMTDEMGKLLTQSNQEVDLCSHICKWTASTGPDNLKDEERELPNGGRGLITYAPIGIVYGIQPWNYPAYQIIRFAIANLMAGNAVLLKHAESVTGTGELVRDIFEEAGLPKGLFTVIKVTDDDSEKVVNHNLVRGITLTGSPKAGEIVGAQAGKALKKTVLELGSNDAYLVLDDADLKIAVEQSVKGRIYNNGETCIAAKRFVVVASVYEEFKNAFVSAMEKLKIGDPLSDEFDMGPMARKDLREILHEQVTKSVDKGATILCGGKLPEGDGYFYPATVLEQVRSGQPAYDDELFGPVASIIKAKDNEDAMRIANDSRFGLGGGIFSKNEDAAFELAKNHFDTGMVFINSFGLANPNMPFGGVKRSGFGREHGGFGMKEFVNVKAIMRTKD